MSPSARSEGSDLHSLKGCTLRFENRAIHPMLALQIVVASLGVLAMVQLIGEWIIRWKRQKRNAALKQWIDSQESPSGASN
jgi:hypothetical protein